MAKHLIIMHGRSIKPAEARMKILIRAALSEGLYRAGDDHSAAEIEANGMKISYAYYGDVNNQILYENDKSDRAILIASDPDHNDGPAFPHELLGHAMELSIDKSPVFNKNAYRKVLADADDLRLKDDAASAFSLFGELVSFGYFNKKLIEIARPDMARYLDSHVIGSKIRKRLHNYLDEAIVDGDDIMLITHSMGCMVAYDVFWKYSHRSEYEHIRQKRNPVKNWLTIGCPLAEPGVRRNLLDARWSKEDRYPRKMFDYWVNIRAEDDYIAHRSRMKGEFKTMTSSKNKFVKSITDLHPGLFYNCWVYANDKTGILTSNPHDLYGYLINAKVGRQISKWINA